MQRERLSSIMKQALDGDDHASEIKSEPGVTTSTGGSADEAGTGGNSSGTEQHQVPVQPVSADGGKLVFLPLALASGDSAYKAYCCTPVGSEPGTSSQSGDGGGSNSLSFGDGMNRSASPVSLTLPEPPPTSKSIFRPRATNSNPADIDGSY